MTISHVGRRTLGAVAVAVGLALLWVVSGPGVWDAHAEGDPIVRTAGADRAETAVAVSEAAFDRAPAVVLARSDVYADALSGAPLAVSLGGPTLLTASSGLNAEVAAEIERLGAAEVVLLGGEAALSAQVEHDVEALGVSVRRIAGATRFATAGLVAEEIGGEEVVVTEGIHDDPARGWPDAVSVSAYAAHQGHPLLLVSRGEVPADTRDALDALATTSATIIGGTAAVSDDVEAELAATGIAVDRIAGGTRYETSVEVAAEAHAAGLGYSTAWLVTGRNWPDSLVAAPAAAALGQQVFLVDGVDLDGSEPVREWAGRNRGSELVVVGGAAAISDGVEAELRSLLVDAVGQIVELGEDEDGLPYAVDADGRRALLDPFDETWEPRADARSSGAQTLEYTTASTPDQVDLTEWQTPIRNQGGRGTCSAFAVVAAMEAQYLRQGLEVELSEQLANHLSKGGSLRREQPDGAHLRENHAGWWGGMSSYDRLDRLSVYHVPLESEMPYVPYHDYGNTNQPGDVPRIDWQADWVQQRHVDLLNVIGDERVYAIPNIFSHAPMPTDALAAGGHRISSWTAVPEHERTSATWYEAQLYAGREVVIGATMCSAGAPDDDGIRRVSGDCSGGHSVLFVGYDRTSPDPDDHHFIVKNSWGGSEFERWSYDYVREGLVSQAGYLDGVVDPDDAPTPTPQTALGRWNLEIDGQRAILNLSRLSGWLEPSELTNADGSIASEDLRMGSLYLGEDADGDVYRVNGEVSDDGVVEVWANLDLGDGSATQNLHYDSRQGAVLRAQLRAEDLELLAGHVETQDGRTLGFYASKDDYYEGVPVGATTTGAAALPGRWEIHNAYQDGPGVPLSYDGIIDIHEVQPDGTVIATAADTGGQTADVSGTFDASTGRLDLGLPHVVSEVTAYLHAENPSVLSGVRDHSGGVADGESPLVLVRTGDVADEIEIVEPLAGETFVEGEEIHFVADTGPGSPGAVRWYDAPDQERLLGTGTTTGAKLGAGPDGEATYEITAVHGEAVDTVEIHVTASGVPNTEILSPEDGSFHFDGSAAPYVYLDVQGVAHDPEDGWLVGDALQWSYREVSGGQPVEDWVDSGERGVTATLELLDHSLHAGVDYEIRLTATDSHGNARSHVITVSVASWYG